MHIMIQSSASLLMIILPNIVFVESSSGLVKPRPCDNVIFCAITGLNSATETQSILSFGGSKCGMLST